MKKKRLNICLTITALIAAIAVVTVMFSALVKAASIDKVYTISGTTTNTSGSTNTLRIETRGDSVYVITGNTPNNMSTGTNRRVTQGCSFDNDDSVYEYDPACEYDENGTKVQRIIKNVGDFHSISSCRAIKVVYTQGKPGDIKIVGPEKLVRYLDVSCDNGELELSYQNGKVKNINNSVTVTCSSRGLNDLDLSTASKFIAQTPIKINGTLNIDLSSAASASIPAFQGKGLTIDCSSASSLNIPSITANSLNLDLASAAKFHTSDVNILGDVEIDLSSASNFNTSSILNCNRFTGSCSGAAGCNIQQLRAYSADIDCSSAANFRIPDGLNCNNNRVSVSASSTATISIDPVQAGSIILEATSQSNITLGKTSVNTVRIEASMSTVTLRGKGNTANIEAWSMARINAGEFSVGSATVDARNNAKITIKADRLNRQ